MLQFQLLPDISLDAATYYILAFSRKSRYPSIPNM